MSSVIRSCLALKASTQKTDRGDVVLRGRMNPADVGRFQISETYHAEAARKLGMNIYTREGNTAYARCIFSKHRERNRGAGRNLAGTNDEPSEESARELCLQELRPPPHRSSEMGEVRGGRVRA